MSSLLGNSIYVKQYKKKINIQNCIKIHLKFNRSVECFLQDNAHRITASRKIKQVVITNDLNSSILTNRSSEESVERPRVFELAV